MILQMSPTVTAILLTVLVCYDLQQTASNVFVSSSRDTSVCDHFVQRPGKNLGIAGGFSCFIFGNLGALGRPQSTIALMLQYVLLQHLT